MGSRLHARDLPRVEVVEVTTVRHYSEVVRYNGRPALVKIDHHPNGTRYVRLDSIEYLDGEFTPEMRDKLMRVYRETVAPQPPAGDHKSPAPGVGLGLFVAVALLGLVMACLSQPLSGGVFFGALLAAVGVAGVARILHVNTGRNR